LFAGDFFNTIGQKGSFRPGQPNVRFARRSFVVVVAVYPRKVPHY
jgi:hypothetical protein